jgi:hypothetical protein
MTLTAKKPADISRETPATQMRILLTRLRDNNLPFERAWDRAWKKVKWPHPTEHRVEWKATLEETREVWHACYERRAAKRGWKQWANIATLYDPED